MGCIFEFKHHHNNVKFALKAVFLILTSWLTNKSKTIELLDLPVVECFVKAFSITFPTMIKQEQYV